VHSARWLWLAGLLLGALVLTLPGDASAQGVFAERWSIRRTEHFIVYTHASVDDMADEVANMCEQAHALLVPLFGAPPFRTHVILTDSVDAANGSATVIPLQVVRLQAMPPESGSTLGNYHNWMWNLIVHEYTHVLQLSQMSWVFRVFNAPAGRRAAPNQQLPRWLIEGIATWAESAYTGSGRVNQSLFQAMIRQFVWDDRFPDLGALNGAPTWWPNGGAWYLFGAFFVDDFVSTYGADALAEFIRRYGRRLIPFGISVTFDAVVGRGIEALWLDFGQRLRDRFTQEYRTLELQGFTPVAAVSEGAFQQRFVTATRDGRCVGWMRDDGYRQPGIQVACGDAVVDAQTGPVRRAAWTEDTHGPGPTALVDNAGEFDLSSDGERALLSMTVGYRNGYAFRDLFELDLALGTWRRLTEAGRAREPRWSPDEHSIAYVRPAAGRTDLIVMDAQTGKERTVGPTSAWWQYSRPVWSADGRTLFVSLLRPEVGRQIVAVSLADNELLTLTAGMAGDQYDPFYSDLTDEILFSSDGGGFFDIFAVSATGGPARRLTRSWGGLHSPALVRDPDTEQEWIYASELTSFGFRVIRTPFDAPLSAGDAVEPWRALPVPGAAVPAVGSTRWNQAVSGQLPARRMHSLLRVRPFRWQPTVTSAEGQTLYGVSALGGDPVGIHSFDAGLQWDSLLSRPVWAAQYMTAALPVSLTASTSGRAISRPERFYVGGGFEPYVETEVIAGVGISSQIPWIGSSHGLSAGWTVQRYRPERGLTAPSAPDDPVPVFPEALALDGLSLGWGWRDTWAANQSISTERGTAFGLGLRIRSTSLGSDADTGEFRWSASQYVPMPWRRRHVLAIQAVGSFAQARGVGRRLYGVGGLPPQDVLTALNSGLAYGTYHVRGYDVNARVGNRYFLSNVEYRLPLWDFNAGIATLPLFFQRAWLAVFSDFGDAWDGRIVARELLFSSGAELRLSATLGYFEGAAFRLGVARGWVNDGRFAGWLIYGFQY
jgi:hypothetical protein